MFLLPVILFSAGIAVYFGLRFEPAWGPVLLVMGCAGLGALGLWGRRDGRRLLFLGCIAVLCVSGGMTAAKFRTMMAYTPMLTKATGPRIVTGTVEAIDLMGQGTDIRLLLREVAIEKVAPEVTPRKIRLRLRNGEGIRPGQRVSGLAALNPPSPPVAPNAFDFQRAAYFEGIGAVGFFYRTPDILAPAPDFSFADHIEDLRLSIAGRIAEQITGPSAGVMTTLMTGQRRATGEDDIAAMRDSGLAHLLAISGLHVGMIAACLFFFSRLIMAAFPPFALRHPIKKYAALIAFCGALFYTLIAGMTVPTQRALLMTGIALLAIMCDRSPFSLRLVGVAAALLLLITPDILTGVSFQMSFAAVLSLVVFFDAIRPVWVAAYSRAGYLRRGALYILGVFFTSIVAGFATGLFSLFHFQTFALYNLLANMIAVPVMGAVVMPAAVGSMALMPFGLEGWALDIMAWGVTWIIATARWVAGLDGAVLRVGAFPFWLFIGLLACALVLMLGRQRGVWIAAFLIMVVGILAIPLSRTPDILINNDASLVAVKNPDGALVFSKGRGDSYAAETWLRHNGEDPDGRRQTWPKEGRSGYLSCDELACRYERKGQRIALLRSPRAIEEECRWAGMLIAPFPVRKTDCPLPYIIDRFSVWREGAQSLYVTHNGIERYSVEAERGVRPWTQTAARAKKKD